MNLRWYLAKILLTIHVWAARDHMPVPVDGTARCIVCDTQWPCYVRTETDARAARLPKRPTRWPG